ncbi:MAG TPA: DUF2071 domain-containing protein [Acidimicrobiales bacterium]|nr:DUF2071 domain-containing protein [Acidimicrobiales bacterium]
MAGNRPEARVRIPFVLQDWRAVTFVHWRCEPEAVARLLPPGLTPDVLDGSAWVALTPFLVRRFRAPFLPPLPGVSEFPETNLRTYVRAPDGRDGLWFLSLDAGNLATVAGARVGIGAPYCWGDYSVEQGDGVVRYQGRRRHRPNAEYRVEVQPTSPPRADVDDLVARLVGRWRAYTRHVGRLWVVPVEHEPWPVQEAKLLRCDQSVTAAAGLPDLGPPALVHFAEGVHARLGIPAPARALRPA